MEHPNLDCFNDRLAKMLNEVVQEVMNMVKETVSAYQEKTASTLKENESLRRSLLEIQNILHVHGLFPDKGVGSEFQGKNLPQRLNNTLCDLKRNSNDTGVQVDGAVAHTLVKQCKEETEDEEALTVHMISDDTLNVIKSEPGAFSLSAPSTLQEHYNGCVDPNPFLQNSTRPVHPDHTQHSFDGGAVRTEPARRDSPFPCQVCGKTFNRVSNLKIHLRCHTGEKPYGCSQCGKRFIQAGDLKKHKLVHTGEKPYYCSQCGKRFNRAENLKRHLKIHIGQ